MKKRLELRKIELLEGLDKRILELDKEKQADKVCSLNCIRSAIEFSRCYFDEYTSIEAIAYLVSLVEGKEYQVKETLVGRYDEAGLDDLYNDAYREGKDGLWGELIYLTTEDKEEKALSEIGSRFNKRNLFKKDYIDGVLKPSDNYILLGFREVSNSDEMAICYGREIGRLNNWYDYYIIDNCLFMNDDYNLALITDKRYDYIYDYMESVIYHELSDLDCGHDIYGLNAVMGIYFADIELEDMKAMALSFVSEYNKSKKKIKRKDS